MCSRGVWASTRCGSHSHGNRWRGKGRGFTHSTTRLHTRGEWVVDRLHTLQNVRFSRRPHRHVLGVFPCLRDVLFPPLFGRLSWCGGGAAPQQVLAARCGVDLCHT
eukprot:325667-Chlamydomonas_euryale.AAC.1